MLLLGLLLLVLLFLFCCVLLVIVFFGPSIFDDCDCDSATCASSLVTVFEVDVEDIFTSAADNFNI